MAFCPSASSSDATDGKEGEEKKKKAAPLEHLATIDGCGADGLCTLKGRQEAMKKQKEMEKARLKEAAAEEEAKTNNAP